MNKKLIMLGLILGSTLGAYVPVWFGASTFSVSSVVGTFVGGIIGIMFVVKLSGGM